MPDNVIPLHRRGRPETPPHNLDRIVEDIVDIHDHLAAAQRLADDAFRRLRLTRYHLTPKAA